MTPLGMEVGLSPGHNVLDGDLAAPNRGTAPIFGSCLLGTDVGLGPGDIVLDIDPAPPKKGRSPLTFRPMSVVAKCLDAFGTKVGLGLGHIVLDGDPASPLERRHSPRPIFGRCLLWPSGRPSQLLLSTCFKGPNSPCGLQGVMQPWFICWFWCYYIVCLFTWLPYFFFLYLFFLTYLLPYLPFP